MPSDAEHRIARRGMVLLGEIHGARENVELTRHLLELMLRAHTNVTVGFEWPNSWTRHLARVLAGSRSTLLLELPRAMQLVRDGLLSREHLELVEFARRAWPGRVDGICFDDPRTRDWNVRDATMARELAALAKSAPASSAVLAVCGEFHAMKTSFRHGISHLHPLGTHFPQAEHIRIRYAAGAHFNDGRVQPLDGGWSEGFFDGGFDQEVCVPVAHPTTPLCAIPPTARARDGLRGTG